MKKQSGFTLIELIMVIVILGILAAVALPKFTNVAVDARIASLNGFAGGLGSAAAIVSSQYMVNGSSAATTVTMKDGTSVVVTAGTGASAGVPVADATGIAAAMRTITGFSATTQGTGTGVTTFQPSNGGSATCKVDYSGANGSATVTSSGC